MREREHENLKSIYWTQIETTIAASTTDALLCRTFFSSEEGKAKQKGNTGDIHQIPVERKKGLKKVISRRLEYLEHLR